MLTYVHEYALQLLDAHPEVIVQLCVWAGIPTLPNRDNELQTARPELPLDTGAGVRIKRPDLFLFERMPGPEGLLLALWMLELQRGRDETRVRSWAANLILAEDVHKVEPETMIVALGTAMERWCEKQLAQLLTRHNVLERARVIGPSKLPDELPNDAYLATMMAVMHRRQAPRALVQLAARGLLQERTDQSVDFLRMLLTATNPSYAQELIMELQREYGIGEIERESFMFQNGFAEGEAVGRTKGELLGRAEGEALGQAFGLSQGIRAVLHTRGLPVPESVDTALTNCADPRSLTRALHEASSVTRADDLLSYLRTSE
ncbi:MAG: hypothetical protein HC927_08155 [Deltaproteobacteria bacterium]|nr:hypothetical protein [Deltaproteobacteria bacterium]